jgi:PAS domain-containing protein
MLTTTILIMTLGGLLVASTSPLPRLRSSPSLSGTGGDFARLSTEFGLKTRAPSNPINKLSDERRLQLLIDSVIDYAIYVLDLEGRVASWNSGAERLKGYTAGEILGQSFSRFFTVVAKGTALKER